MYKEITKEQEEEIKKLFTDSRSIDFSFKNKEDGYYITVSQMYDYCTFKGDMSVLRGYLAIADILGCTEGNELGKNSFGGCETCDYGSSYTTELRFW